MNQELAGLPSIPLPTELKNLPPLPKDQENVMRTLARQAVEIILERYRSNQLQTVDKRSTVKTNRNKK